MKWQLARLLGVAALLAIAFLAVTVGTRAADHSVPAKRGIAILPPAESPDFYDPGVGGKTIYTPYYVDYGPRRHLGPRFGVPANGYGYFGKRAGVGVPGPYTVAESGEPRYGEYSGAPKDESYLLHLGGFSGAEAAPAPASPDVIDMIRSGR